MFKGCAQDEDGDESLSKAASPQALRRGLVSSTSPTTTPAVEGVLYSASLLASPWLPSRLERFLDAFAVFELPRARAVLADALSNRNALWRELVSPLQLLCASEQHYRDLQFDNSARMSLDNAYTQCASELQRICEVLFKAAAGASSATGRPSGAPMFLRRGMLQADQTRIPSQPSKRSGGGRTDNLTACALILEQLRIIINIRLLHIGVYRTLARGGSEIRGVSPDESIGTLETKNGDTSGVEGGRPATPDFAQLLRRLSSASRLASQGDGHTGLQNALLTPLRHGYRCEFDALTFALRAQLALQHHDMKGVVVALYKTRSALSRWGKFIRSPRDSVSGTSAKELTNTVPLSPSSTAAPRALRWLALFRDSLAAKATLYFFFTLRSKEAAAATTVGSTSESAAGVMARRSSSPEAVATEVPARSNTSATPLLWRRRLQQQQQPCTSDALGNAAVLRDAERQGCASSEGAAAATGADTADPKGVPLVASTATSPQHAPANLAAAGGRETPKLSTTTALAAVTEGEAISETKASHARAKKLLPQDVGDGEGGTGGVSSPAWGAIQNLLPAAPSVSTGGLSLHSTSSSVSSNSMSVQQNSVGAGSLPPNSPALVASLAVTDPASAALAARSSKCPLDYFAAIEYFVRTQQQEMLRKASRKRGQPTPTLYAMLIRDLAKCQRMADANYTSPNSSGLARQRKEDGMNVVDSVDAGYGVSSSEYHRPASVTCLEEPSMRSMVVPGGYACPSRVRLASSAPAKPGPGSDIPTAHSRHTSTSHTRLGDSSPLPSPPPLSQSSQLPLFETRSRSINGVIKTNFATSGLAAESMAQRSRSASVDSILSSMPSVAVPFEHERGSYQGIGAWPAVFCLPASPPLEHWPNIVSLLMEGVTDARCSTCVPFCHFEKHKGGHLVTYFLCEVEPSVTLALVFDGERRKEKDKGVLRFFAEMIELLRGMHVWRKLRES